MFPKFSLFGHNKVIIWLTKWSSGGHQMVTKWSPCCHYIVFKMVVMVVLVMMPLLQCRARGYIRTMNGRQGPTSHVANQRTKDVGGWVRAEPSQSPKYRLVMRISLPEGPHPPFPSFNLDNPTFANWTEGLYKLNRVSWELVIRLSNFVDDILKTSFKWWPFLWWSL